MLIASAPSAATAIAINATDSCSPVDSSMTISRAAGWSVISEAKLTSSSVFLPRALTTITTWWPAR